MKLQIHTSLERRSAIGRLSLRLADELALEHEVVIVAPEAMHPARTDLPVCRGPLGPQWTAVYLIGGHEWFAHSMRAAREFPGLAILHDVSLLAVARACLGAEALGEYLTRVRGLPTDFVVQAGASRAHEIRALVAAPCTELVAAGSLGLVTHSQWAAQRVRSQCLGPTRVLALPEVVGAGPATVPAGLDALRQSCDQLLVSVGHANPNRCLPELIEAIGQVGSAGRRIGLVVAGSIDHQMREQLTVAAGDRDVPLLCTGYLPDSALRGVLAEVDACAALRRPVLEGASASVLDQMASGRPVIVARSGHYAELPGDCVVSWEPASQVAGLAAAVEQALGPSGAQVGERARHHVRTVHTDANYARGVLAAVAESEQSWAALAMMEQLHDQLVNLGAGNDAALRRLLLEGAWDLFGPSGGGPVPG